MKRPIIIAVAGGSASGKTTVVNEIKEALEGEDIIIIKHDDYYKDQSHLSLEERKKRDKEKDEYARQHNIPLIRICYLEKDKINIEKILKSEVREIYGL